MKDNTFNFNQVFLNTLDSRASEQLLSFLHLNNISVNISEKSLSILLAKASFAFLLISMLSYWFQMSFKAHILMSKDCKAISNPYNSTYPPLKPADSETYPPTQNKSQISYSEGYSYQALRFSEAGGAAREESQFDPTLQANSIYSDDLVTCNKTNRKNFLEKVPLVTMWLANVTLALLLFIRWIESGHFPLSNLYESLLFLSWSLTVIHLFLENLFSNQEQILSSPLKWNSVASTPPLKSACSEAHSNEPHTHTSAALEGYSYQTLQIVKQALYPDKVHFSGGFETHSRHPSGFNGKLHYSKSAPNWGSTSPSTLTLGAITSPVALFTNAFATFSLPQEMQKVTVLVPALKSNWLIMHVSVMIISYAALLSGSLLAMAFLVIKFVDDKGVPSIMSTFVNYVFSLTQLIDKELVFNAPLGDKKQPLERIPLRTRFNFASKLSLPFGLGSEILHFSGASSNKSKMCIDTSNSYHLPEEKPLLQPRKELRVKESKPLLLAQPTKISLAALQEGTSLTKENVLDLPQILDNLSYRSIGLGFALLTIGILSGAVWANEAWGSYWSWDPKETWALITWLVFALYLHTRLSKGWVGKESALVASFGFVVIWFCYLGVNLFGKGLHSYGWFQQ